MRRDASLLPTLPPILTVIARTAVATGLASALALGAAPASEAEDSRPAARPFAIEVVDAETGRGVPLVELETVNAIRLVTDSNGLVAFDEPGLMGERVFFFVKSHGYEFPADGFGMRGKALDIEPGGRARLEVRRVNIAERLYRLTGGGIYRDSVLLGRSVPLARPLLNGLVFGQDSVFTVVHAGKLYWFWGDTGRPAYPLGNFHMSGATSRLPGDGGLDPEVGVDLEYFVDEKGFSRGMAPMPGEGPTWADAFVTLPDGSGRARLFAAYAKIRPGGMETHDRGFVRFDDERQTFEKVGTIPLDAPVLPGGHAFKHVEDGVEYVYFATPFPVTRVRATAEAYLDLSAYEAFTPLVPGSRAAEGKLDRAADGTLRYGWKKGTPPLAPLDQDRLLKGGKLKPEEARFLLRDADTGKPLIAHAGSVYHNPYRKRWVLIDCEQYGTSFLGETWFAEADTPLGPWAYARKVVTHEKYSFYNPKQHPMLAKEGGRVIFFEGTYTNSFSGNAEKTPRYDYNQVLYRLDLADRRLVLPVPVYRTAGAAGAAGTDGTDGTDGTVRWGTAGRIGIDRRGGEGPEGTAREATIPFFALDRPREGSVAVRAVEREGRTVLTVHDGSGVPESTMPPPRGEGTEGAAGGRAEAAFHALPPDAKDPPPTAVALFEVVGPGGTRDYATADAPLEPGARRAERPLCLVWRNPLDPRIRWGAAGARD